MVELDKVIDYALSLNGAVHERKVEWDVDLMRVCGKIFLFMYDTPSGDIVISLKCDPDWALELREMNEHITAAFHLNKKHWNSIEISKIEVPTTFVNEMVKHSYEMVVAKMPAIKRKELLG